MEYFDVLSEDGSKSGRIVSRTIAHRDGILHGTSQIFVYRVRCGALQILLQKRSDDKDSFPGLWDISCAGHVPSGATFSEAARKELSEELGLTSDEKTLTFLFYHRSSKRAVFHGKPFWDEQISAVYVLPWDGEASDIRFQREEIAEVKWFDAQALSDRLQAGDPAFCISADKFRRVLSYLKGLDLCKTF